MPDVSIKVIRGIPSEEDINRKLKSGEKVLWLPDYESRRRGCMPMLSICQRGGATGTGSGTTYHFPIPGMMGNG